MVVLAPTSRSWFSDVAQFADRMLQSSRRRGRTAADFVPVRTATPRASFLPGFARSPVVPEKCVDTKTLKTFLIFTILHSESGQWMKPKNNSKLMTCPSNHSNDLLLCRMARRFKNLQSGTLAEGKSLIACDRLSIISKM